MEKQNINVVCYLKTDPQNSYFRIGNDGVLTVKLDTMKIASTKSIASSPYRLIPSNSSEFEKARNLVLDHLKTL